MFDDDEHLDIGYREIKYGLIPIIGHILALLALAQGKKKRALFYFILSTTTLLLIILYNKFT